MGKGAARDQTEKRDRKTPTTPATKPVSTSGRASGSKQRVAAYCRVSTGSEEQLTSYPDGDRHHRDPHENSHKCGR